MRKKRNLVFINLVGEGLLFDANRFRVRNGGDAVGGLAGDGDREVGHLGLRRFRLLLEILNHPVLLLHGIAAPEVVAGLVIAGPFGAGRIGGRGAMRQNQR